MTLAVYLVGTTPSAKFIWSQNMGKLCLVA